MEALLGSKLMRLSRAPHIFIFLCFLTASCTAIDTGGPGTASPSLPPEAVNTVPLPGDPGRVKQDFQLPATVTLCGEILPLNLPTVRERLETEFLLVVNHTAQVELWRRRALRYFPLIEQALKQAGLPDDLKYLAVAESDLRPFISSPAGATGLWQFMPSTARYFGLKVDNNQDQRLLPEPLLQIGLKYLSSLYTKFGSWSLAMAAYNAGDARIARALSAQGATDYFQLDLTRETERYVYRIAAIKIVMSEPENYHFTAAVPKGLYQPIEYSEQDMTFAKPMDWTTLGLKFGTDYKTIRSLNPHLAGKNTISGGPFTIRIPKGALEKKTRKMAS